MKKIFGGLCLGAILIVALGPQVALILDIFWWFFTDHNLIITWTNDKIFCLVLYCILISFPIVCGVLHIIDNYSGERD